MENKIYTFVFMLVVCVTLTQTCSINDYVNMGLMERFLQSDIVVYGRTIQHIANKVVIKKKQQYVIDAVFEVHCILKPGEYPVNELVTIVKIAPRDGCSGTPVTSLLKVGDYAIVALEEKYSGTYALDEVMPGMTAVVSTLKPYFFSMASVCTLQSWMAPVGAATNRCPVCGTADFASEVGELSTTLFPTTNCQYSPNDIATNMTGCDLFMMTDTIGSANSQTCIPADFNQTCVNVLYRAASATCDCTQKKSNSDIGIGAGTALVPSKMGIVLLLALLSVVMTVIQNYGY